MIRYTIELTKKEVEELTLIIQKGSHTAHTFRVSFILLNCDTGKYSEKVTNEQIKKMLRVSLRSIERVKKRFVEEGMEAVLERRTSSRVYQRLVDGDMEAKLVTLCCSEPPKGYSRWSLRLLADTMVQLKYAESISHVTIRKVLKKTNLNLGR